MSAEQRQRKKRSRWGADTEAKGDRGEAPESSSAEIAKPVSAVAGTGNLEAIAKPRRSSRWGRDQSETVVNGSVTRTNPKADNGVASLQAAQQIHILSPPKKRSRWGEESDAVTGTSSSVVEALVEKQELGGLKAAAEKFFVSQSPHKPKRTRWGQDSGDNAALNHSIVAADGVAQPETGASKVHPQMLSYTEEDQMDASGLGTSAAESQREQRHAPENVPQASANNPAGSTELQEPAVGDALAPAPAGVQTESTGAASAEATTGDHGRGSEPASADAHSAREQQPGSPAGRVPMEVEEAGQAEAGKLHAVSPAGLPEDSKPAASVEGKSQPQAAPAIPDKRCSLYVGSIHEGATEAELRAMMEEVGPVVGCKLVRADGDTTKHKGFGFVMMATKEAAEQAVATLNGKQWGDKHLEVRAVNPEPTRKPAEQPLPGPPPRSGPLPSAPLPAAPVPAAPVVPVASYPISYPPYDPHYNYYAAYQPMPVPAHPSSIPQPAAAGDERPPGEEDEAAPGTEATAPHLYSYPHAYSYAQAYAYGQPYDYLTHVVYQGVPLPQPPSDPPPAAAAAAAEEPNKDEKASDAPPPPPAPPSPVRVPLKVPESVRKKQEEKRKAREERAKQAILVPLSASSSAPDSKPADDQQQATAAESESKPTAALKPTLPKASTLPDSGKGSWEAVLARRKAELAGHPAASRLAKLSNGKGAPKPPDMPAAARSRSRSPKKRSASRSRSARSHSSSPRGKSRGRSRSIRQQRRPSRSPSPNSRPHSPKSQPADAQRSTLLRQESRGRLHLRRRVSGGGQMLGAQQARSSPEPSPLVADLREMSPVPGASSLASPLRSLSRDRKRRKKSKGKHHKKRKGKHRKSKKAARSGSSPSASPEVHREQDEAAHADGQATANAGRSPSPEAVLPRRRKSTRWQPEEQVEADKEPQEEASTKLQDASNDAQQRHPQKPASPVQPSPQVSEEGEIPVEDNGGGQIGEEPGEVTQARAVSPPQQREPPSFSDRWQGHSEPWHGEGDRWQGSYEDYDQQTGRGRGGWRGRGRGRWHRGRGFHAEGRGPWQGRGRGFHGPRGRSWRPEW